MQFLFRLIVHRSQEQDPKKQKFLKNIFDVLLMFYFGANPPIHYSGLRSQLHGNLIEGSPLNEDEVRP